MNQKTLLVAGVISLLVVYFVLTRGCIYTAIATFNLLSALGYHPEICLSEVEGHAPVHHAWVRVGGVNIEQATLNIHKSPYIDYENPMMVFASVEDFIPHVNMLSALHW